MSAPERDTIRHQLEDVLSYEPPNGWHVLDRAADEPLTAVLILDDGTVPEADWATACFHIARYPHSDASEALARYLATRVRQGRPEYVSLDSEILADARAARWTDGVHDIVSCTTARCGGVLLEIALNPWELKNADARARAAEHIAQVDWLGAEEPRPGTVIRFYSVTGEHGDLSNFAPYPIRLDGQQWRTSEHYFQAQKFEDARDREEVRSAKTPAEAARRGRDRKRKLRRDWESRRDLVMRAAVEAKFRQHADLATRLLATGTAKLVEHTDADSYWGDGGDGSGSNRLGIILMEVRTLLAKEAES